MTSIEEKEAPTADLQIPGVVGVVTIKEFVKDNFEARLEYTHDNMTISVKDKSNQQIFCDSFSQKAIADMNFNQPISNVVSMIIMANDKSNDNTEQSALSLVFGYFDNDTPLPRNGFSNQYVDQSKLATKFVKGDALYLIVIFDQSFFKVQYMYFCNSAMFLE